MIKSVISGIALASAFGFAASPATAATTVLTFTGAICGTGTQACTGSATVSQNYGDGTGVDVSSRGVNVLTNATAQPGVRTYTGPGYGDLSTIAYVYGANQTAIANQAAEFTFAALAGYELRVLGFDAGCYLNRTQCQAINYSLAEIGNLGAPTLGVATPPSGGHSSITFADGYSSSGYVLRFGPDAFNGGITNVAFDVREIGAAVPEPSAWALLILGFGLVGGTMRRTRTKLAFA